MRFRALLANIFICAKKKKKKKCSYFYQSTSRAESDRVECHNPVTLNPCRPAPFVKVNYRCQVWSVVGNFLITHRKMRFKLNHCRTTEAREKSPCNGFCELQLGD
ncbi:hypothetical protein AMECASPLE_036431 [Ameca splendens]|uniref:Secreted protein n=1 Tax=Ameca splendens TaxID=208324 RepID=A0ABV0YWB8_9TELE